MIIIIITICKRLFRLDELGCSTCSISSFSLLFKRGESFAERPSWFVANDNDSH